MYAKTLRRPLLAGLLACAGGMLPVLAQTGSPYEPELQSIVLETKVDLANIKTPAPLPAALTGLVSAGVVEFRSRIDKYDPVLRTFRTTLYITPPSTPTPAPEAALPGATDPTMISQNTLRIQNVFYMKGAPPAFQADGRFVTFLGGALPVAPGTPFVMTFAYPTDAYNDKGTTSATFGELSFLIPGQINVYATAPVGSITVTPASSN